MNFVKLHENNYDTGRALQALVKIINPKSIDKRWSDDDAVVFSLPRYMLMTHNYTVFQKRPLFNNSVKN